MDRWSRKVQMTRGVGHGHQCVAHSNIAQVIRGPEQKIK